jgi:hypothetical protein
MPLAKQCNQYKSGVPMRSVGTDAQVTLTLRYFASLLAHADGCDKPKVWKFTREWVRQNRATESPVTQICPGYGSTFTPHRKGQVYCTRGRGNGEKDCRYLHMRRLRLEARHAAGNNQSNAAV